MSLNPRVSYNLITLPRFEKDFKKLDLETRQRASDKLPDLKTSRLTMKVELSIC